MARRSESSETPTFVYRISTKQEWEELQKNGSTFGGDLDKKTGCIHLSNLSQVASVLRNFFQGREGLYLLQIDAEKLGEGLIYEAVDALNVFPHFYGPSRSFSPLKLDAITRAEKLEVSGEPVWMRAIWRDSDHLQDFSYNWPVWMSQVKALLS